MTLDPARPGPGAKKAVSLDLPGPGLRAGTVENRQITPDPSAGSGGIRFIRMARGITLTITDCTLYQPVPVHYDPPFESLAFGFSLSGRMEIRPGSQGQVLTYRAGQSDLNLIPGVSSLEEVLGPGRLVRLCLTMNHEALGALTRQGWHTLPALLRNRPSNLVHLKGRVTPAMRSVIAQIMHTSFEGAAQELFLEGKVLELLAHKLAQVGKTHPRGSVRPQDLDRVLYAADLLTRDLEKAPGLEALARAVGMCRTRLHDCFCQVHGITPFEYLQKHRLETAMAYLTDGRMNVTEAAFAVGYASSGYFSRVFKRHFGAPPGTFARRAC